MFALSVRGNIWKIYVLRIVSHFALFMPVIVLFFEENGLSMQQVFVVQAVFSLVACFSEIPTGYFSDVFGRKASIVVGSIFVAVGHLAYVFSYGFWGFLISEIILGFAWSFISGSDSAILYDTLLELGKQDEYQKVEGRSTGVSMASEGLASVLGGLLALISLRTPLAGEVLVTIAVIPVALSLYEPKRKTMVIEDSIWKSMIKLVKFSLYDHKEVKWLTIYSAIGGASTLTMVWMIQPILKNVGVSLGLFGTIWAALMLFSAVVSWNAHRIERYLGRKMSVISIVLVPVIGYALIGVWMSVWTIPIMLFFYFARGLNRTIVSDYINQRVTSDIRATVLSTNNLVSRVIFVVVGPIVGWVSDERSLGWALIASAVVYFSIGYVALLHLRKYRAL